MAGWGWLLGLAGLLVGGLALWVAAQMTPATVGVEPRVLSPASLVRAIDICRDPDVKIAHLTGLQDRYQARLQVEDGTVYELFWAHGTDVAIDASGGGRPSSHDSEAATGELLSCLIRRAEEVGPGEVR